MITSSQWSVNSCCVLVQTDRASAGSLAVRLDDSTASSISSKRSSSDSKERDFSSGINAISSVVQPFGLSKYTERPRFGLSRTCLLESVGSGYSVCSVDLEVEMDRLSKRIKVERKKNNHESP